MERWEVMAEFVASVREALKGYEEGCLMDTECLSKVYSELQAAAGEILD